MMRRFSTLAAALLLSGLAASPALAQQDSTAAATTADDAGGPPGRVAVTTQLGVQVYDTHSAIRRSALAGLIDLTYALRPWLGLGVSGSVARPTTDETYFSLVEMHAADTTLFYRVHQRVTQYTLGAHLVASGDLGRVRPYAMAGAGFYSLSLDPQALGATERMTGPLLSLGAGLVFPVGTRAGLTLDLRDQIFTSFDRNQLDATDPLFRTHTFDAVPAGKPAARSIVHNPVLALGVRFLPDRKRGSR